MPEAWSKDLHLRLVSKEENLLIGTGNTIQDSVRVLGGGRLFSWSRGGCEGMAESAEQSLRRMVPCVAFGRKVWMSSRGLCTIGLLMQSLRHIAPLSIDREHPLPRD